MKNEPVVVAITLAVLTGGAGAADALATNHTTAGICLAVGTGLTAAAGVIARSLVTPVAKLAAKARPGAPKVSESQRY